MRIGVENTCFTPSSMRWATSSGLPTQGVVERLEALEINEYQGDLAVLLACVRHLLLQPPIEHRAIGQSGQGVVIGKIGQLVRLRQIIDREGDVVGEFLQQL
jgi:hypothetical protein